MSGDPSFPLCLGGPSPAPSPTATESAVYPHEIVAAPTESKRKAYRIGAWASAAVAFVAAVLTFAFGLAAVTGPGQAGDGSTASTQAGPRTTGALGEVLAADQAVVSGTVTSLVGTNIDAPALVLPVTLTVERGGGTKADFSGGTVAGKPATLSWDGGRPLTLSGQGSLDFNGPVNVEVTAAGATWSLDGSSRLLTAGTYIFGATVAVSLATNALGAPKDGARFDVAPGAAASLSTKGDVRITTAPAALTTDWATLVPSAVTACWRSGPSGLLVSAST